MVKMKEGAGRHLMKLPFVEGTCNSGCNEYIYPCNPSKLSRFYAHLLYQVYRDFIQLLKPRLMLLYVIGSIAKDEASCFMMKRNDNTGVLFISDLDLIVFTDLISYIKCKLTHCDRIGAIYTEALRSFGIETHVSTTITSLKLYKFLKFLKFNTINLYEMRKATCHKFLKICVVDRKRREPSTIIDVDDALNLVISSIADYIHIVTNHSSETEALYTITKRILSLFYALDLALGFKPQSFTEAPLIVMDNLEKMQRFIDENDLKILKATMTCRRSLDPRCLLQHMNSSYSEETRESLLDSFYVAFEKYAERILQYFIEIKALHITRMHSIEIERRGAVAIAEIYKQLQKLDFAQTFIVPIYLLNSLLARKHKQELAPKVYALLKHKLILQDFLRYLVLKFFTLIRLKRRNEVLNSHKLKELGFFIADLWYRYML